MLVVKACCVGNEISELGRWVFEKFSPGDVALSADQVAVETNRMMQVSTISNCISLESVQCSVFSAVLWVQVIDSDGDSKVSFEEFVAYLKKMGSQYRTLLDVHKQYDLPAPSNITLTLAERKFKALDKDNSGFLCLEEAEVFATWIYTSFQTKEGKLSEEQAKIEATKLMHKLDVNGDGNIIFEEFEAFFNQRAAQSKKIAAVRRKKGHKHVDCLNEDHDVGFAPVDVSVQVRI